MAKGDAKGPTPNLNKEIVTAIFLARGSGCQLKFGKTDLQSLDAVNCGLFLWQQQHLAEYQIGFLHLYYVFHRLCICHTHRGQVKVNVAACTYNAIEQVNFLLKRFCMLFHKRQHAYNT